MKFNWHPTRVAFLDFETQSECDISLGSRRYARHPSTRVLTCAVKVDGRVERFGPYLTQNDKDRLVTIAASNTLVAHNAPFDAAIWDAAGLPSAEWFDTLPCARAAGLPGGLDKLSLAVGGRGKDKNGSRLIDMLCILKPGKAVPAVGAAHRLLLDYNVQDVEELELVYGRVKGFGEPDVMTVDRTINDRGIPVDRSLLQALVSMYDENTKRYGDEFAEHTKDPDRLEGLNPRSPKQLQAWLKARGVTMPSLGKATVDKFFSDPDMFMDSEEEGTLAAVSEMLELRRELAGVGRGKVDKAVKLVDEDSCIRDQFVYYGAHLGRWSSRGLQLHNMPSSLKVSVDMRTVEPTYASVYAVADRMTEETKTQVTVSDCLNIMLRRMVQADNLLVVDYGAVEARCLAWIADEETMLEAFRDPKESVYLRMGDVVFQRRIDKKKEQLKYVLAKVLVLGCGYGMSGAKFKAQCAVRESREFMKMLADSSIDLAECVKTYRKTYPRIPQLWKECGDAVLQAVAGVPSSAGRCEFHMVGSDMHLVLPSGRPIVYRNARIEPIVPAYCKMYNMPENPVPTVTYDNPRGFRGFLYGAKIVENVCQGTCRDMLADALVRLEDSGLPVLLHVHDEIVCSGPESRLGAMCETMTTPPSWADGFPVLVEGYSGPQWTKTTHGYTECRMLNGRRVC